jgi:hypothetical protein
MLYEACVVKPELFQDVRPEMGIIQESGEFAPDVTQPVAGAHTRGKAIFPKSKSVDTNVASGRNGCPLDFLDAHTDKKVCPFSREEKEIMRKDSELIVRNRSLRHLFQGGGVDGILYESEMINGAFLIVCIAEKSYVSIWKFSKS